MVRLDLALCGFVILCEPLRGSVKVGVAGLLRLGLHEVRRILLRMSEVRITRRGFVLILKKAWIVDSSFLTSETVLVILDPEILMFYGL